MPHIAMSTGSACSSGTITRSHVLTALKLNDQQIDESFRISFGRETNFDEINSLITELKSL
jgi:cysteine desulfurase